MTITSPRTKIERRYRVVLTPKDGPGDAGEYEPRIVRLTFWPDEIEKGSKRDPRSERALAEAAKRAEKLERREFDTADDTEFDVSVEYLNAGVVPAGVRR